MAGQLSKKRKTEDGVKGRAPKRPVRKFKKQTDYDSGSGDDEDGQNFDPVNLEDSDEDELLQQGNSVQETGVKNDGLIIDVEASESEVTDASNSNSEDEDEDDDSSRGESNPNLIRKRKRNDPEAFATSMSKILGSKLSTSKRSDPVLSRSVTALQASKEITDQALEKKAKHKLREERKAALDKGRVKDVLGASTAFDAADRDGAVVESTAEVVETEKRLRKTAQRGVVKLFNAVRAAQIKGEEAAREARKKGLVGHGRREDKVNEMSKRGFLELIAGGGGGLKAGGVEEA